MRRFQISNLSIAGVFSPLTFGRLLILSYFLGLATGLVDGTKLTLLTEPFMSESIGKPVVGVLVVSLCVMVLIGIQRRGAALLLSLILFWASYMTMHQLAVAEVNFFWRDMALIGGLLFSADLGGPVSPDNDGEYGLEGDDGVDVSETVQISEPNTEPASMTMVKSEGDTQYRQDFDLARVT